MKSTDRHKAPSCDFLTSVSKKISPMTANNKLHNSVTVEFYEVLLVKQKTFIVAEVNGA